MQGLLTQKWLDERLKKEGGDATAIAASVALDTEMQAICESMRQSIVTAQAEQFPLRKRLLRSARDSQRIEYLQGRIDAYRECLRLVGGAQYPLQSDL